MNGFIHGWEFAFWIQKFMLLAKNGSNLKRFKLKRKKVRSVEGYSVRRS